MLNVKNIKALVEKGFTMAELGIFNGNDQKAETALEYLAGGLTTENVREYLKADDAQLKSMMGSKKKPGKQPYSPNPENVLETSASVLEAEINFGGMKGPGFVEWSGMACLTNTGTGRKANSLFVPFGKDGKIDLLEARAKIEATKRVIESHLTVLDTVSDYFKAQGDKMGVDTTVKID